MDPAPTLVFLGKSDFPSRSRNGSRLSIYLETRGLEISDDEGRLADGDVAGGRLMSTDAIVLTFVFAVGGLGVGMLLGVWLSRGDGCG